MVEDENLKKNNLQNLLSFLEEIRKILGSSSLGETLSSDPDKRFVVLNKEDLENFLLNIIKSKKEGVSSEDILNNLLNSSKPKKEEAKDFEESKKDLPLIISSTEASTTKSKDRDKESSTDFTQISFLLENLIRLMAVREMVDSDRFNSLLKALEKTSGRPSNSSQPKSSSSDPADPADPDAPKPKKEVPYIPEETEYLKRDEDGNLVRDSEGNVIDTRDERHEERADYHRVSSPTATKFFQTVFGKHASTAQNIARKASTTLYDTLKYAGVFRDDLNNIFVRNLNQKPSSELVVRDPGEPKPSKPPKKDDFIDVEWEPVTTPLLNPPKNPLLLNFPEDPKALPPSRLELPWSGQKPTPLGLPPGQGSVITLDDPRPKTTNPMLELPWSGSGPIPLSSPPGQGSVIILDDPRTKTTNPMLELPWSGQKPTPLGLPPDPGSVITLEDPRPKQTIPSPGFVITLEDPRPKQVTPQAEVITLEDPRPKQTISDPGSVITLGDPRPKTTNPMLELPWSGLSPTPLGLPAPREDVITLGDPRPKTTNPMLELPWSGLSPTPLGLPAPREDVKVIGGEDNPWIILPPVKKLGQPIQALQSPVIDIETEVIRPSDQLALNAPKQLLLEDSKSPEKQSLTLPFNTNLDNFDTVKNNLELKTDKNLQSSFSSNFFQSLLPILVKDNELIDLFKSVFLTSLGPQTSSYITQEKTNYLGLPTESNKNNLNYNSPLLLTDTTASAASNEDEKKSLETEKSSFKEEEKLEIEKEKKTKLFEFIDHQQRSNVDVVAPGWEIIKKFFDFYVESKKEEVEDRKKLLELTKEGRCCEGDGDDSSLLDDVANLLPGKNKTPRNPRTGKPRRPGAQERLARMRESRRLRNPSRFQRLTGAIAKSRVGRFFGKYSGKASRAMGVVGNSARAMVSNIANSGVGRAAKALANSGVGRIAGKVAGAAGRVLPFASVALDGYSAISNIREGNYYDAGLDVTGMALMAVNPLAPVAFGAGRYIGKALEPGMINAMNKVADARIEAKSAEDNKKINLLKPLVDNEAQYLKDKKRVNGEEATLAKAAYMINRVIEKEKNNGTPESVLSEFTKYAASKLGDDLFKVAPEEPESVKKAKEAKAAKQNKDKTDSDKQQAVPVTTPEINPEINSNKVNIEIPTTQTNFPRMEVEHSNESLVKNLEQSNAESSGVNNAMIDNSSSNVDNSVVNNNISQPSRDLRGLLGSSTISSLHTALHPLGYQFKSLII